MLIVQEQQMLDCPNTDMKKEYRSLLKTANQAQYDIMKKIV